MWFKTILRPKKAKPAPRPRPTLAPEGLLDEQFFRTLEQLEIAALRFLRGNPASGQHQSQRLLPTTTFSEHRPYTPGDDLRYVDWNAYARNEHILLKRGEAEQDVHVHLLLDTSRSMAHGPRPRLRTARRLAAALGYLALSASDRLHVAPLNGQLPLGPLQGKPRLIELLRYLDETSITANTDLRGGLTNLARRHPRGGIAVLISDLLSEQGLAEGLHMLRPPRWQTIVIQLLNQDELQPELSGPIELEDSESGERLELILDDEQIATYRQHFSAWQQRLGQLCARNGATFAPVVSEWALDRQVLPFLRARAVLKR